MIGRTLGNYRIVEQIGMGGMATVYKAYDPDTDRFVALKVLAEHYSKDPMFQERFRREAKSIARLENLHILPVHAYGEQDGVSYLVMRYLEAGTLSDRIKRGPLPLSEASQLLSQIAGALDYAHAQGIIHRDIKPGNILLDKHNNAFLTDFGIAKIVEGTTLDLTGTGIIGTPLYMSPEQCRGDKNLTAASDIYSLGIVLYEMVTGRTPFQAETPLAVIHMQLTEPLPPPHTLRPDLSEAVEAVIYKALSKEPESRYQTCTEMANAFALAISSTAETVSANAARTEIIAPVYSQTPPASANLQGNTTYIRERRKFPILAIAGIIGLVVIVVFALFASQMVPPGTAASTEIAQIVIDTSQPLEAPTNTIEAASSTPPPTEPPTSIPTTSTPVVSAETLMADAQIASDQSNPAQAVASLTQAIELDPLSVDAYTRRGDIYQYDLEDYEAALADYNQAIELDPESTWAYINRGNLHRAMGNYDQALDDLNRAIELDPEDADAYIELGNTYSDQGAYEDATAAFTYAVEIDPENPTAHLGLGKSNTGCGCVEDAIDNFTQAIELDPTLVEAYILRGELYQHESSDYEAALNDYNQAIELDPDSSWGYADRGDLYGLLGNYEQAIPDLIRATELDPEDASALVRLGELYSQTGEIEIAIEQLTKAIQIDDTLVDAYILRGDVYKGQENYDAARADYDRALELDPESGWALTSRGDLYLLTSDYENAIEDLLDAISYEPDEPWAYALLGNLYDNTDQYSEALQFYLRYQEITGDEADPDIVTRIEELRAEGVEPS